MRIAIYCNQTLSLGRRYFRVIGYTEIVTFSQLTIFMQIFTIMSRSSDKGLKDEL